MENMKHTRIVALFALFVLGHVLLPGDILTSIAQDRSVAPKLEGTEWEGAIVNYPTAWGLGSVQCCYIFGNQEKAISRCRAIQSTGVTAGTNINDPMFNPMADNPYKPKVVTTPMGVGLSEVVGKFMQHGSSVRIEFPGAVVNATINDNVMSAETIYRDASKNREKWEMQRLYDNECSAIGISLKESVGPQPSTSLSKQVLEKYKPTALRTRVLSGQLQPGLGMHDHYYTFTAGPGEITLTLFVESQPQSLLHNALAVQTLLDSNERVLGGSGPITSSQGEKTQTVATINLPSKQPVLLRISENGLGKYRVELSGAVETR